MEPSIKKIGTPKSTWLPLLSILGMAGAFFYATAFAVQPNSDNTDPVCGDWNPSGTAWASGSVRFTLSNSTDADSGIKVDGGDCTATSNGDTCSVTIEDNAGNTRSCTSPTARIDTALPSCWTWDPSGQGWGKTSITFRLSWSTDGLSWIDVAGGNCTVTSDNSTCQVTIRDKAGNTRTCTSPTGRLDTTPPVCDSWYIQSPPSTSFSQWNGNYDEGSIPWTKDKKTIYVMGSDTGGSGLSNNQAFCTETNDPVSIAFCTAVLTDNVGNSRTCGWPNLSPRVRQDGSPPPKPTVSCSGIDPADPGRYECSINTDPTGPSPTLVYYRIGSTGSWNYAGRYWFLSQNGSLVPQDTQVLRFPLNLTQGSTVSVYVKFEETGGTSESNAYSITVPTPAPTTPPVTTNPNPVTTGSQTFSYVDDTGDWYTCSAALGWPSLPEGHGTASRSSTTYCSSDGDGWGYPAWTGTAGNGGSMVCKCRDIAPPIVDSVSFSPSGWTNAPVSFSTSVSSSTLDGSPYRWVWYACQGQSFTFAAGSTSASFSCSGDSASAQTATIKACDSLQCTQRTITYYKESTPPSASISITGRIGNHAGETPGSDSSSSSYTKTPGVTLTYSASDSGGSGLDANPVKITCSSSPSGAGSWTTLWTGTLPFNLTSGPGCSSGEGTKTVYIHARDIAGNIRTASASIIYDTTPPSISGESAILLLARAAYSYTASASDGLSGIRDYTIAWYENGELLDRSADSSSATKNFGNLAQYINDNDLDARRDATVKIAVEDRAGNLSTLNVPITIIANMVAFNSETSLGSTRTPAVADVSDAYNYVVRLKDANGNLIRPVTGIRTVKTMWEFDNTSNFLGNSSYNDGAIWYNWDSNGYSQNVAGNAYNATYSNSNQKTDGIYRIGVKSAVPTRQGYPDYTGNQIRLSKLEFENAIPNCPSGYVCIGTNANPSYPTSLGVNLASAPGMNAYLAFKPALEVTPEKDFNVLTDNSWHPVRFVFKNNSATQSFVVDQYRFNFHYATNLGPFADIRVRGDFGEQTQYPDSFKKVPFVFTSGLPSLSAGGTITKNIEIQTNSYGYGFGKFGFSAYLPYGGANNVISGTNRTGYNTANLGLLTGVTGYGSLVTPVPDTLFGNGVASGQKVAVRGSIGDKGNNALNATLENGVKIDAKSIDRNTIKTNIRQNAYDLTRSMDSANGSNCNVTISDTQLGTKDVHHYDFTNLSSSAPINGNAGCVLTIRGSEDSAAGYKKLRVSGKRTIVVKGGNVYVDSDIYYADGSSMLALVVLRGEKDRKRGGNVFVNPKVTNVSAAAYSEGSIISYNGSKVYEKDNTSEGELTKQLLWYGSAFSANTIGGSLASGTSWKCPFGSDRYEATGSESCSQSESSKYDFAALRRFIRFNASTGSNCVSASSMSAKLSGTTADTYAFAGKPRCFTTDSIEPWLRKTPETAAFVIEYNAAVQTSGMRIFSTATK